MKILWEIVASSTGKRVQVCNSLEDANWALFHLQTEGRIRYEIKQIRTYETHEQEISRKTKK